MKKVLAIAACLLAATAATSQTFRISLEGERETAPGDENGVGFAILTVDGSTLHYFLWVKGIDAPTASHVHRGALGVSGPVVIPLSSALESAGEGAYWAAGSVAADAGVLGAIAQDPQDYYVNVHNGDFPDGALRGQVLGDGPSDIALATDLRGDRERPVAGDPGGTGSAAVILNGDTVTYYLWTKDIDPPTLAHIHRGVAGESGPVVVGFDPTFVNGLAVGTVSADAAVVAAIGADPEGFYVNVHNGDFPGGALRGQLAQTETVLHLPVVARNAGVGTSNYVTDARVANLTDSDATVWVEWYPADSGGLDGPVASVPLTVAGAGEAVIDDIVGTLFAGTSKGALRLLSPTPFRAVANTYNDQRASGRGTFGQFEEALPLDRAFLAGTLPYNSHRPKGDATGWRTNLGYFNPRPGPVDVTFDLHRPDGSAIATQGMTFPGYAGDIRAYHELLTAVPAAERAQPNFVINYSANLPVFIYSSVVDNVSDDGLHQPALAAPAFATLQPTPAPTPTPTPTVPGPTPTPTVPGPTPTPTPTVPGPTPTPTPTVPGPTPTPTTPAPTPTPTTPAPTPTPTVPAPTPTPTTPPSAPTLSDIQATIFTPRCIGCHGGSSPEAGMNLSDGLAHANLVNVAATTQSGIRVVPGDPANSVLVTFLASGHRSQPAADQQTISEWVSAGAANN